MRAISIGIICIILLVVGKSFFPTFGEYSEGDRTGDVSKFTQKGWMFKTWEGELVLGGLKTDSEGKAITNLFEFSVADQSVIDTLNANPGANVTLHYTEYFNVNIYEGSTDYLVTGVTVNR